MIYVTLKIHVAGLASVITDVEELFANRTHNRELRFYSLNKRRLQTYVWYYVRSKTREFSDLCTQRSFPYVIQIMSLVD